ncbi:sensor histidine kinase [Phytoactinopolyspora endophytica]|uniref:sensor histidine kinase n=1 Tax=Phytoactinopolyspora endophytica TaxID=1642495 RepID=UPI00101C3642|nr:histidine kinase [Phytoactinopolyspora endophytica]
MTAVSGRKPTDLELQGLLPGQLVTEPDPGPHCGGPRRSARDWVVDVLCFLIALGLGAWTFVDVLINDGWSALRVLDLAAGSAACVSLWWRRRWPVHLALAITAVSTFATSSTGAVLIAIFTVAVHRKLAVTAVVTAVNILVGMLYFAIYPDDELPYAGSVAFVVLLIVAVAMWGMFVRARRQLVLSLRERARQAESEAHLRVEQGRHRERERIAREMHDVLAHRLSLLSVHANALVYRPDAPAEDIAQASGIIRDSAHQALQDLREVIGVLRAPAADPDDDAPHPTLDDLTSLVGESRQAGMHVTVADDRDLAAHEGNTHESNSQLPAAVARCAYRVVQEGLTNARKHARGARVTITLTGSSGDGLQVRVHNTAPSGPSSSERIPGAGTGLVGLSERVELAGGTLRRGPTADGGFALCADLPWPA